MPSIPRHDAAFLVEAFVEAFVESLVDCLWILLWICVPLRVFLNGHARSFVLRFVYGGRHIMSAKTSPAYRLTEPETHKVRWDMSDYSEFGERTTCLVWIPKDPLADGRNGRNTQDTVEEVEYDERIAALPIATAEQHRLADECIAKNGPGAYIWMPIRSWCVVLDGPRIEKRVVADEASQC